MRNVLKGAAIFLMACASFGPVAASAQTPVAATPVPGPGVQVEILVQSGEGMTTLNDTGTPVPSALDHRLARITIQPGAGFLTGPVADSGLLYVEQGQASVQTAYGVAQVSVGEGEPVVSADDGSVVCDQERCDIQPGEAVVLGPGNGLVLAGDTVEVHATGSEAAVIELSTVMMAGNHPLCWICPTI